MNKNVTDLIQRPSQPKAFRPRRKPVFITTSTAWISYVRKQLMPYPLSVRLTLSS